MTLATCRRCLVLNCKRVAERFFSESLLAHGDCAKPTAPLTIALNDRLILTESDATLMQRQPRPPNSAQSEAFCVVEARTFPITEKTPPLEE
jgi:hypothetical protein